jgi:hypothetical protein
MWGVMGGRLWQKMDFEMGVRRNAEYGMYCTCKMLNGRVTKVCVLSISLQHICVAALGRCSLWRN